MKILEKKKREDVGKLETIYLKSNSFEKFRLASFRTAAVGRAASVAPQWKETELQADLCHDFRHSL